MFTPPPSVPPIDAASNREILWKVIGRYDAYIGATNTKAAAVGALVTFVVGTAIAKWADLIEPIAKVKLVLVADKFLLGVVCCGAVGALYRSIQAIDPDLSSPERPGKYHSRVFFGDVAKYNSPDDYLNAVKEQTDDTALQDCAYQAHALAAMAAKKFAYLQKAIWWLKRVLISGAAMVAIWAVAVTLRFLM